jgi:hypothetical protein
VVLRERIELRSRSSIPTAVAMAALNLDVNAAGVTAGAIAPRAPMHVDLCQHEAA